MTGMSSVTSARANLILFLRLSRVVGTWVCVHLTFHTSPQELLMDSEVAMVLVCLKQLTNMDHWEILTHQCENEEASYLAGKTAHSCGWTLWTCRIRIFWSTARYTLPLIIPFIKKGAYTFVLPMLQKHSRMECHKRVPQAHEESDFPKTLYCIYWLSQTDKMCSHHWRLHTPEIHHDFYSA